jgi:hypothetical protein
VLVLQIRGYPLEDDGDRFTWIKQDAFTTLAAAVSAPVEALLTARGSSAYHRNNELLDILNRTFNAEGRPSDYFATVVFELNGSAALSWYLTTPQKTAIAKGFYNQSANVWTVKPEIQAKMGVIGQWFGTGGR